MESEDGTGGRHPLLGDVDCHPPIPFGILRRVTSVICLFYKKSFIQSYCLYIDICAISHTTKRNTMSNHFVEVNKIFQISNLYVKEGVYFLFLYVR